MSSIVDEVKNCINVIRKTSEDLSDLFQNCSLFEHDEEDGDGGEVRGDDRHSMVEEEGGNSANSNNINDTAGTADTGAAPPTSLAEQLRLAERGVAIHNISGDETEDKTLLDKEDDELEEGSGDTGASSEAASAALLATITYQEGLVLTGGDWFKTIKNAAENNVKTDRELAEILQMSQATLKNEVFEGNPPTPSPANAGPGLLQKKSQKKQVPLPEPPLPAPLWLQKNWLLLIRRTDALTK
jgi:hypothetical protein